MNNPSTDINKKAETPIKNSFFGLIRKVPTSRGTIKVSLNLKVLAIYLVLLGSVFWIGKSAALYYFFKEVRNFDEVTIGEMVLFPFNRSALREAQGDYQVKEGIEAVEAGEYRQALVLLRQGITRSPDNPKGRLYLSRIYVGWRNDLAIGILEEGYERGIRDEESLKLLLNLLYQEKEDRKVLDLSSKLLEETEDEGMIRFANAKKIQSALATGQLELADKIFRETDIKSTMDGLILGSDLLVKLGHDDEAISILQSVLRQFPDEDLDPVFSVLFGIIRKNEKWDLGKDVALSYSLRKPLEWEPRIILIEFLEKAGETNRRDQEISAVFRNHSSSERAMMMLASTCAELGLSSVSNKIYSLALQNHYSMANFTLLLIESYVNSKNPAVAIRLIDQLVEENPTWLTRAESQFNIIRSLAYYRVNDSDLGNLYLTYFIESRLTRIEQIIGTAQKFAEMGNVSNAIRLYEEAFVRQPENERVLSQLIYHQINEGNADQLSERLKKLIELRRPSYDIVRTISDKLKSDRFIFTEDRDELIKQLYTIASEPMDAQVLLWNES